MKKTKSLHSYFTKGIEEKVKRYEEIATIMMKFFPIELLVIDVETQNVRSTNMDISKFGPNKVLKCYELSHGRDKPCWENPHDQCECPLLKIKENGEPVVVDHTHYENGEPKFVRIYASPILNGERIIEFCVDITSQKKTEGYLDLLVNHMPRVSFWVKDSNHKFLFVDKTKAEDYGKGPEYFIGKTEKDLGIPEKEARRIERDEDWVMNNKKPLPIQIEWLTRNGQPIALLSIKTPLYDDKGRVVGTFGHAINITRREKIKKALLKILENLQKHTLKDNLREVVDVLANMMEFERVSVGVPNKSGDWIIETGHPKVEEAHGIGCVMLPKNTGNLLTNIRAGKPVYINDPQKEANHINNSFLDEHGITAIAIVPFPISDPIIGESMGLLAVDITREREYQEFTPEDKDLMKVAATVLGNIFSFYNEKEARIRAEKVSCLSLAGMSTAHEIRNKTQPAVIAIKRLLRENYEEKKLKDADVRDLLETALELIGKIEENVNTIIQNIEAEREKLEIVIPNESLIALKKRRPFQTGAGM